MDAAGLVLIVAGLGLALVGAGSVAVDDWQQQQLNRQWERELRSLPPSEPPAGAGAAGAGTPARATPGAPGRRAASPPRSDAVFALRIPKLGYYAAVRQGVTLGVLGLGPGHYPTTAWPGQRGNVGVAAHNVFWLQFDRLRPGDQIVVEARDGAYRYRVAGSRVISPDDSSVLAADGRNRLTLTTCWPLWAGALAPKRFAISAIQEP
jgi:sortase A